MPDHVAPTREQLADLLRRCRPIIQADADMMADISRHAPLDPASQSVHDATEYESERLLPLIDAALAGAASRPVTTGADVLTEEECLDLLCKHYNATKRLQAAARIGAERERERAARKADACGKEWWRIHCDTNRHMATTRAAHEEFCALAAAIRRGNELSERAESGSAPVAGFSGRLQDGTAGENPASPTQQEAS